MDLITGSSHLFQLARCSRHATRPNLDVLHRDDDAVPASPNVGVSHVQGVVDRPNRIHWRAGGVATGDGDRASGVLRGLDARHVHGQL